MKKELLIPFKEFVKRRYKRPYIYSIEKDNQHLLYFGAAHTEDINHPQFSELDKLWEDFLSKVDKDKTVMVVESDYEKWRSKISLDNKEELVKRMGDPGYATYLANKASIPFIFPEKSEKEVIDFLCQKFNKRKVFYFYVISAANRWLRKEPRPDLFEFLSMVVVNYNKIFETDYTLDDIKNVHRNVFGKELEPSEKLKEISWPVVFESEINEIARAASNFRDLTILDKIEELWDEGKSIFIVYGSGHALVQEPVIKSLVG